MKATCTTSNDLRKSPPDAKHPGQAFGGGVFVAGAHLDAKTDAQVGDEITVNSK